MSRRNLLRANRWPERLPWIWLLAWFSASALSLSQDSAFQLERALLAPSALHWLGFDAFGRDALVVLLRSSIASAGFATVAVAATFAVGIIGGASIALAPSVPRAAALRLLEFTLAFPSLLIALAWAAVSGPGWDTLLASLCIGTLPGFVRLMYVRSRELLSEEYVVAARSLGASDDRIALHHLGPALLATAWVKLPGLFAYCLLAEATLSFLGVGAPVGGDTWGALLAQAKDYLLEAPHLAIAAGTPLLLTALSLQLLSEQRIESPFRGSASPSRIKKS